MSQATRVGVAGAAVMAVAFGMARYVYGLTLPALRADLEVPEFALGLIASGTFTGFLLALILARPLSAWKGPRAATIVGGVCGTAGCALVAVAFSPVLLAAGALVAGGAAGWVWAPYSDVITAVAPERDRPRLLAWVTTGASGGLILVGPLALGATALLSWRWTWAGIGMLSAAATVVNIRWVPRVPPVLGGSRRGQHRGLVNEMLQPLAFALVLFSAATAYFTYATDAAQGGGLGEVAGPAVFLLTGTTGLAGLGVGRLATTAGPRVVGVGALVTLSAALVVLSLGTGSLVAATISAAIFGAGNTVGSAALSIWTAQVVSEHPAAAFTATLVAGSLSSIVTPAVIGTLIPYAGLPDLLLATAAVTIAAAIALLLTRGTPLPHSG